MKIPNEEKKCGYLNEKLSEKMRFLSFPLCQGAFLLNANAAFNQAARLFLNCES